MNMKTGYLTSRRWVEVRGWLLPVNFEGAATNRPWPISELMLLKGLSEWRRSSVMGFEYNSATLRNSANLLFLSRDTWASS